MGYVVCINFIEYAGEYVLRVEGPMGNGNGNVNVHVDVHVD